MPSEPRLILASTSRYRAELLSRLRVAFLQKASEVDETAKPGEEPAALARRLAGAKARAVAVRNPECWVLGSDQTVDCHRRILGKPGDVKRAIEQLEWLSGRVATFTTAVALANTLTPRSLIAMDSTRVKFRRLKRAEIERYVELEPAFDCAGSFKAEGLGISLFERIEAIDPTGLIGLPLIATRRLLIRAGYAIP